jgi:hypothetical protein
MAAYTTRRRLIYHTLADLFRIQDYADNWQNLDSEFGFFFCTSSTRPNWDVQQEGMAIFETDTKLIWHWDGAAWERLIAVGSRAEEEINVDVETSSTTYITAITANAAILAGGRRHLIVCHAPGVYNTNGLTILALFRDAELLQEWSHQGGVGAAAEDQPRPIFAAVPDTPGEGAVAYTLQVKADATIGGTSTIVATATKPLALDVIEI